MSQSFDLLTKAGATTTSSCCWTARCIPSVANKSQQVVSLICDDHMQLAWLADPGGYLDKLAALLPAAVKAWREAGLLYCTA